MYRLAPLLLAATICPAQKIAAPRIWNDQALADWAAPVAGLNVRPGFFPEKDYQAAPQGEWVRSYPVYFPGREPAGYWEMLRNKKPEPLITPGARTAAEWVAAGQQVFRELDLLPLRNYDPKLFAILRSAEEYTKLGGRPLKDGTIAGLRLVPTSKGLAISFQDCAGCHIRTMPDGTECEGAPFNKFGDGLAGELFAAGSAAFFRGETAAVANWRAFAVPWLANDIHGRIKTMPEDEINRILGAGIPGTFARFNGSPYYMTKVPDLIGIGDRKYIDATATHRLRAVEDIARYDALVTCCDSFDFARTAC